MGEWGPRYRGTDTETSRPQACFRCVCFIRSKHTDRRRVSEKGAVLEKSDLSTHSGHSEALLRTPRVRDVQNPALNNFQTGTACKTATSGRSAVRTRVLKSSARADHIYFVLPISHAGFAASVSSAILGTVGTTELLRCRASTVLSIRCEIDSLEDARVTALTCSVASPRKIM